MATSAQKFSKGYKGKKPAPSRQSGGTSGNLTIKGHKTKTPVLPYVPSEPSHIVGVGGATKSSAKAVQKRQTARIKKLGTILRSSTPSPQKPLKPRAVAKPKPIPSPSEDSFKPAKAKKLAKQGWDYHDGAWHPPLGPKSTPVNKAAPHGTKVSPRPAVPKRPLGVVPKPTLPKAVKQERRQAVRKVKRAAKAVRRSGGTDNSVPGQIGEVLRNRGYNKIGTAGVLGNAYAESSYQPTADDGSGNGGLWGFTAEPVSKKNLQEYAAKTGQNWEDPKVQTRFLTQHVAPETKAAINHASSPQESARIFMEQFERPGIPRTDVREEAAVAAFSSSAVGKANPKAVRNYQAAVKNAEDLGIKVPKGNPGKPSKQVVTRYKAAFKAASQLEKLQLPYVWGGGHNSGDVQLGSGVDCSGAVSYVLQKMGVKLPGGVVSGEMGSYLEPGPGAVTVFYNPEHTFMKIGNKYFGTSTTNSGGGAGFIDPSVAGPESTSGKYQVGHVPGLGEKVALQLGVSNPDITSFPGMSFSDGASTATIDSGTTRNNAGFSNKPITALQQYRRTNRELKQLGVGEKQETKSTDSELARLEKKYAA